MHVVATSGYVSVTGDKLGTCAEMSLMGDEWFLNRCIVHESERRQGIGRNLIEKLKEHRRDHTIMVTPGGYGFPLKLKSHSMSRAASRRVTTVPGDTKERHNEGSM